MKSILLLMLVLLVTACSTPKLHCDGHLIPINPQPAPLATRDARSLPPATDAVTSGHTP